jgi:RNA polymerase primary sigma factor
VIQQRLTPRQERELVIAAECGDPKACRELVEAFSPAIGAVALGFKGTRVEHGELLQEGVAGLLFAARRYDAKRKTPFWAYASYWVRKAMQELVAELARPVALSDRAVRALARVRSVRREHQQMHGSEPTIEQLSEATGLTRAQVESLEAAERAPRAIEAQIATGPESPATVGDTIADPAAEHAYQEVLDELEIRHVRNLTAELDDRERTVIRAHYGLDEPPQTLTEIGDELGFTAERARQIEAVALAKLRVALARAAPVARAVI